MQHVPDAHIQPSIDLEALQTGTGAVRWGHTAILGVALPGAACDGKSKLPVKGVLALCCIAPDPACAVFCDPTLA